MPNKFKVGDWVFEKGANKPRCLDAKYIEAIEYHGSWDDFTKWIPHKGEWCWFINKERDLVTLQQFDQMCPIVETNYISKQGSITGTVEPFIGYLPMYVQNKIT